VTDFANSIVLTPSVAATHMPTSIFDYMEENFFSWLCTLPGDLDNFANNTSIAVPLENCQCNGYDYYGMPRIDFALSVDQYETGYSYKLDPHEYEMSAKVDKNVRSSKCNLGLWGKTQKQAADAHNDN